MINSIDDMLIKNASLIHTGTPFFTVDDALKVVDICEKESIGILGLDGFYIDENDNSILPIMELICDFSFFFSSGDPDAIQKSVDATREFFEFSSDMTEKRTYHFEFVLRYH